MSINFKIIASCCVLSALIACWVAPASAQNLVTNPSFEVDSAGSDPITDWSKFAAQGQGVTLDDTSPHTGSNALRMCCGTLDPGGQGFAGAFQRVLNIVPGTTYTFSVWARADTGFLTDGPDPAFGGREDVGIKFEWHENVNGDTSPTGDPIIEYGMITSETGGPGVPARPALSDVYQQFVFPDVVAPATAGHFRPVFAARHITEAVYFDDISLTQILPADTPNFFVTVDRVTGNISIENNGTSAGSIKEIKITSASGALDPISWTSVAGNYDLAGDDSVDADDNWTRQTQTNFELSETGDDPSDGGVIAVGAGNIVDLGNNAWIKSLTEDIAVEVTYADDSTFRPGQTNIAGVTYVGDPFERSDLNFDGDITAADWPLLRDKLFVPIGTTSEALAYQAGDLNGDFKANFGDFNVFEADFDAANGVGAFQAMIAGVPEPSTLAMLVLGAMGLSLSRKRKAGGLGKVACMLAVVLIVGAVAPPTTTFAATAVNFTNFNVDYYPLIEPDEFERFQVPTYTTTASTATQDVSSNPHVFYGTQSILNKRITGTINPGADNDFFGLALGYTAGDVSHLDPSVNPTGADFLLLDWKFDDSTQEMKDDTAAHSFFFHDLTLERTATAGVALSRVTGSPTGDELWGHFNTTFANSGPDNNPHGGVDELQRGAASGSTGYVKNQDHVFDIAYTASKITVKINGTEEINISGSFPDGVLGLYSMDQGVAAGAPTYSNFKLSDLDEGLLTATVNTLSGSVTLSNETSDPITLNGYSLESPSGSLNVGAWSSLQDQDLAGFEAGNGTGNGWEEGAGSSDSALVEANLTAISTLGAGASVSLGTVFDTAGTQDLVFSYSEGNGLVSTGLIDPVATVEDADFDGDNDVDGADFLTWQRGFGVGTTKLQGDANASDTVDGADLTIWESQYGTGALSSVQSVPEPNSVLLLIVATCGLAICRPR